MALFSRSAALLFGSSCWQPLCPSLYPVLRLISPQAFPSSSWSNTHLPAVISKSPQAFFPSFFLVASKYIFRRLIYDFDSEKKRALTPHLIERS